MSFLLERIAQYGSLSCDPSLPFDEEAAIGAQIQRIVSARVVSDQYDATSLLAFGMPSVVELALSSKEQLERYAGQLRLLITQYEPRLINPVVSLETVANALMPYRLVVSGALNAQDDVLHFYFALPGH